APRPEDRGRTTGKGSKEEGGSSSVRREALEEPALRDSKGRAGAPSADAGSGFAGPTEPPSFVNGRYLVKRFLGEGGKKRVFLAHDTLLDRDVAFALIKTEG